MQSIFGEVTPLLILAMIAGLVELAKKLGLSGNKLLLVSMALGVVLGVLFQVAEMFPVVSIWFNVGVWGMLFGLAASGLYDLGKRFAGNHRDER